LVDPIVLCSWLFYGRTMRTSTSTEREGRAARPRETDKVLFVRGSSIVIEAQNSDTGR